MKLLFFSFLIFFSSSIFTQMPMGGKGQQSPPNMGHVYGKIVDKDDKPIADVSIVLLQTKFDTATKKRKDVLYKGLITKANGEFTFEDLPVFAALKIKISATGFKPVEKSVSFQLKMDAAAQKPSSSGAPDMSAITKIANAFDKDLGNIKLDVDAQQLQTVTVTSNSSRLRMDIDKKVFNVDKNIVSSGGTALDVMKNIPSVQVDIDGNVKLRNSTPQIYVEGRPTTLTLDQIPADAIESVEVITNPSAKFDASGGNAGILNIILKKNKKTGYNGNIMAGADQRGGMNGGGSFNLRQGKFNITANAFGNLIKNKTTGTLTQTENQNDKSFHTAETELDHTSGGFIFGSLGFDFFATNRTTFSLTGIKVHGQFKPSSILNAEDTTIANNFISSGSWNRNSNSERTFNAAGFQSGMKHLFPKEGENISVDMNYFSGKNSGNSNYTTNYYDETSKPIGTEIENVYSNGHNQFLTIQSDYSNPINDKSKFEAGLRAQIRSFVSNISTLMKDTISSDFKDIPSAGSNYKNSDYVYAAYATFTSAIKNFGYQMGFRAESSNYDGSLLNTNTKFTHNYPVSLFPSLFLSQKLSNKQEIQLSYTRRINRPGFFNMIPYTDRSNKLYVTQGNPDLVPEFTNSIETSYSKSFKGSNSILASIYYKHTTNLITPYLTNKADTITNTFITTYVNANSSYAYGAEFTSVNYFTKWWDVTTNINLYNSQINTTNIPLSSVQPSIWSWFGKINNNFKLPKNFTVQLSGYYQSKTNLPVNQNQQSFGPPQQAQSASQGFIRSFWDVDMAFKKTFFKNNTGSLTLSVSDIFRTRIQNQYSISPFFQQTYSRLNNPQLVRLVFNYRFGKMDMSLFKRKNLNNNGMQGATDGMGQ